MARKTSKQALVLIAQFAESLAHYEEIVRVKKLPLVNQAQHVKEHSQDYYDGWISGIQSMTDDYLLKHNCYHGFHYVDSMGNWLLPDTGMDINKHPEYKPFRIKYFVK